MAISVEAIEVLREKLKRKEVITQEEFRKLQEGQYEVKVADPAEEMKRVKLKAELTALKESSSSFKDTEYTQIGTGGYFKVNTGIYKLLKRNIEKKVSTMLLGPTGIGKTELLWNIAKELGIDVTVFDMGTMSDPVMSLVGVHTMKVEDGKTISKFVPSRFSEVIQKPGLIILDEISRSSPAANNLLFPCLDFRRELPMEYSFGNTKPIPVHPDVVFMSTANIGSQYTGTHKIDRALMDRFLLIQVPSLTAQATYDAFVSVCDKLQPHVAKFIVNTYWKVNQMYESSDISFHFSFRHLKAIGKLIEDGFTAFDGFVTIAKGIESASGATEMINVLKSIPVEVQ